MLIMNKYNYLYSLYRLNTPPPPALLIDCWIIWREFPSSSEQWLWVVGQWPLLIPIAPILLNGLSRCAAEGGRRAFMLLNVSHCCFAFHRTGYAEFNMGNAYQFWNQKDTQMCPCTIARSLAWPSPSTVPHRLSSTNNYSEQLGRAQTIFWPTGVSNYVES